MKSSTKKNTNLESTATQKGFSEPIFRQHLKHSHAGTSDKWTNILENAYMKNEPLPGPSRGPKGWHISIQMRLSCVFLRGSSAAAAVVHLVWMYLQSPIMLPLLLQLPASRENTYVKELYVILPAQLT